MILAEGHGPASGPTLRRLCAWYQNSASQAAPVCKESHNAIWLGLCPFIFAVLCLWPTQFAVVSATMGAAT